MLQQILADMYIDPELLAELDNEQKQTLFCKMREEQVRRWKCWEEEGEQKASAKPKIPPKPGSKRVGFLMGKDGNPWTWVMGEHSNDKSIDEIIDQEARREALLQAEKEAEDIRRNNEQNINNSVALSAKSPTIEESAKSKHFTVRDISSELNVLDKSASNWQHVKNSLQEHRVNEIYASIREMQRKADELSEIVRKEEEEQWKEREKKAKEAERQIRELARQAREEHKKVSQQDQVTAKSENLISLNEELKETPPPKHKRSDAFIINNKHRNQMSKPPSQEAIMEWFQTVELARCPALDFSSPDALPWFHGMIGRHEAEKRLDSSHEGSFLVRLSERIWGYAVSYRTKERCKHFLIEASGSHYQFFGSGHLAHKSLQDLINYHQKRPLTVTGQEYLLRPCPVALSSLSNDTDV